MSAVLAFDGVSKSYLSGDETIDVLDAVSLTVSVGELVALAGRSGSGKTTLLTIASGWDRPDTGSVGWFGTSVSGDQASWAQLAIVPQALGLLDELTIEENITLPLRLGDHPRALDPASLMHRLGIDHLAARFPGEVSLGEQQRAAVARAMVLRPALVLADEPVSHQNSEWATVITDSLREMAADGAACLVASHNPAALESADRIVHLHEGRIAAS